MLQLCSLSNFFMKIINNKINNTRLQYEVTKHRYQIKYRDKNLTLNIQNLTKSLSFFAANNNKGYCHYIPTNFSILV